MSGNDFGFVEIDAQKLVEQEALERASGRSRTPAVWVSFKDGDTHLVRLLPPWTTEGRYAHLPYLKTFQHWDVGPAKDKRVICPKKMSDGADPCYICEEISALFETKDPNDEKTARSMSAGRGYVYQVIDRNDPLWTERDPAVLENAALLGTPKIKFMRLPKGGHQEVLRFFNDSRYGDISHHMRGIDLEITRRGIKKETEYSVQCHVGDDLAIHKVPIFGTEDAPDVEMLQATANGLYTMHEHPFFRVATYDETVALQKGLDPDSDSNSVEGGDPSQPSLPEGYSFADWVANAKNYSPMTREEVTVWGNERYSADWSKEQIAECFGGENQAEDGAPDHSDKGCQQCPFNGPCAASFHARSGQYSESESSGEVVAAAPPMMGGRSNRVAEPKDPVADIGGDDSASLTSYLEDAAKGK